MKHEAPVPGKTLSAVWHGLDDLRLEERSLPPVGPTDVLVEIAACGVCATVRATGVAVRHVRPGDRVALDTTVPCGTCFYCREGSPFFCPDRLSVFAVVPATVVFPLPPDVDAETGALAEPLSCALHAVERAAIRSGDTIAIVGAGAIGLLVLAVARLGGAVRTIVSDPEPARRELARRMGADHAVGAEAIERVAAELTDGRGIDCVFEAAGVQASVDQALRLPRRGGTVVQVSVPMTGVTLALPAYDLFARELTIRGSFIRSGEFRRAVELLGALDLRPLITERFALRDVRTAFDAARSRRGVRVLVGAALGP